MITWWYEKLYKMVGAKEAPAYNFARLKFMGLNLEFSIEKARTELGYRPRVNFDDAMAETLAWYRTQVPAAPVAVEASV
jgi:2-alkyl-3-oxoalkanoate reductase